MESKSESKSQSHWIKAIAEGRNIRCVILQAKDLAEELIQLHQLQGVTAQALSEATLGALTIASFCKPGERVNLQLQGTGVCHQAFVDADAEGAVRGYVIAREEGATFAPGAGAGIWGSGILSVLRTKLEGDRRPYQGAVPLATGDLERDLQTYWENSEQVPTRLALRARVRDGHCELATAILLQTLGGASPEETQLVRDSGEKLGSLVEKIPSAQDPVQLVNDALGPEFRFQALEKHPLRFQCSCSLERVKRAMLLAGEKELSDILEKEGQASVCCDFCTTVYTLDRAELEKLIEQAR